MASLVRGQMSVEFFLLFSVILLVFGLFFFFSNEVQRYTTYVSASGTSATVAYSVAHSINNVFLGAGGLSTSIDVPAGYSIAVQPHSIVVSDSENRSGSFPMLPAAADVSVPANSSIITITNLNGTISVTGE
ncbi:Uncharacterised protein [uncultured archaeon]|nr:Uncharacterised protein [uncultured archaeon]